MQMKLHWGPMLPIAYFAFYFYFLLAYSWFPVLVSGVQQRDSRVYSFP